MNFTTAYSLHRSDIPPAVIFAQKPVFSTWVSPMLYRKEESLIECGFGVLGSIPIQPNTQKSLLLDAPDFGRLFFKRIDLNNISMVFWCHSDRGGNFAQTSNEKVDFHFDESSKSHKKLILKYCPNNNFKCWMNYKNKNDFVLLNMKPSTYFLQETINSVPKWYLLLG